MAIQELGSALQNRLSKVLRPNKVSQDVRRFLAEAYGFLQGVQATEGFSKYSLDQAIASRLGELSGTPSNPRKPNRLARLDALLAYSSQVLQQAMQLEEEDLGADTVSGIGSSLVALNKVLGGFSQALGLPSSLPGNEYLDKIRGQTGKVGAGGLLKGATTSLPSSQEVFGE